FSSLFKFCQRFNPPLLDSFAKILYRLIGLSLFCLFVWRVFMSSLSKPEKSWILYDVANSAFTMLISTTIPIFFRSLAEQDVSSSTASGIWALTTSAAVLILAVLSPFLGALADYKGMKKKMCSLFLVIGIIGLLLLSFSGSWVSYMLLFVVTRIGYSACNIFYDSMLVDVTSD